MTITEREIELNTELDEISNLLQASDLLPAIDQSSANGWHLEKVRVYVAMINGDDAKNLLDHNIHNRKPKPMTIDLISKALLLGEWDFNGEPIKFDWNGVLLDGQNRLHAIAAAGVAVPVLIVEGLRPEAQITMDRGAKRSLGDILELQKEKSSTNLAATLTLIHVTERGGNRNQPANRPTDGQALRLLGEHPEIRNAVKHGHRVRNKIPLSVTIISTCWYYFSKLDEEDTRDFWNAVATGYHLPTNNEEEKEPRAVRIDTGPYLLRRYLNAEKGRREVPQFVKHAIVIKAWNMYRSDARGKLLTFRGGARPDAWPEPI